MTRRGRGLTVALATSGAGAALLLSSTPVLAHGFGERYDLPVPLSVWTVGAAAAVILSFVVIGVLAGGPAGSAYPRLDLLRFPIGRLCAGPVARSALRVLAVAGLVLVVAAGIFGSQNSTRNIAPTLVWVVWWVGFAYVGSLAGNLWALVNPWSALFRLGEVLTGRLSGGDLSIAVRYPPWLAHWPAVALFLGFAWIELVYPGSAVPANLALLALAYSVLTWGGMLVVGRHVWLRWADPFAQVFGLLARFSPTEVRISDPAVCAACSSACREGAGDCVDCTECAERAPESARQWNLRPFGVGLMRETAMPASLVAFVILLLSTVTFDGFMATPAWSAIESAGLDALPGAGGVALLAVRTLGLVTVPVLFLLVYALFARAMGAAAGVAGSTGRLMRVFVLSLVPIALGYHFAHYLTFLLIQGQRAIPLLSDPFGFGWNVLGTASYTVDIAVVGARFAWYTAVTAIVVGHMVAVWTAHVVALPHFGDRARALRSQYPMLVLMVAYTVVSLWIVAQPIVEGMPSD